MRVSLKAVPGVDSVDVSLEKGLAVVKDETGQHDYAEATERSHR